MSDDRGPQIRDVAIAFLVLPWLAVSARCYVRIKMIKAFALDDWLAIATLLLLTAYTGLVMGGVSHGVGKHVWEVTASERIASMKIWYYGEIMYIITAATLRLAVGAFLLRIAIRPVHRKIIYALLALNVVFNIYYLIFTIFQCSPIDSFWLRASGDSHQKFICHSDVAVNSTYASSAVSAFIDWGFGILPVFILWELNVTMKKKIALGLIMGLGALASAGPLVRIPETKELANTEDFLFDTVGVGIWSFVEPGIGLTAISLLTLRPLFVKFFEICSTVKSDAMSISDHPPRPFGGDRKTIWQSENQPGGLVIIQAIGDQQGGGRWTPDSVRTDDGGLEKGHKRDEKPKADAPQY